MAGPQPHAEAAAPADYLDAGVEDQLHRVIRQRLGIVLQPHQHRYLVRAVHDTCADFDCGSPGDLVRILSEGDLSSPVVQSVITRITVAESYFLRDPKQIEYLRQTWLPDLLDRRRREGRHRIRVWTPGCACGQDTYTLALVIRDALPLSEEWDVVIMGSDIDSNCLETAERGLYTRWSLRATPQHICDRYFRTEEDGWRVDDGIKAMARFRLINLAGPDFPSVATGTQDLDLILCRNVFIYFEPAAITRTLERFAGCLAPGGEIVVGASDLNLIPPPQLEFSLVQGFKVFRRAADRPADRVDAPVPVPAPDRTVIPARAPTDVAVAPGPRPRAAGGEPPGPAAGVAGLQAIRALMDSARWQDAVDLARDNLKHHAQDPALLLVLAEALANLGRLDEGRAACARALELESTLARGHYIDGLILFAQGAAEAATAALKRAVFLDPDFIEALYHLGLLHLRQGRVRFAIKYLENVITVAKRRDGDTQAVAGMTNREVIDVLRAEIGYHTLATEGTSR
ncbi:MAG: tetratricopeptide repeat protein [Hyphomicrobiales bacterium]|nr:tetratricopeptide repeat protein [Hyphomicrobiales bacterium]MCP5370406.1 tetratricopeptide repeat protein [Hyphomicrobiales bacterium]